MIDVPWGWHWFSILLYFIDDAIRKSLSFLVYSIGGDSAWSEWLAANWGIQPYCHIPQPSWLNSAVDSSNSHGFWWIESDWFTLFFEATPHYNLVGGLEHFLFYIYWEELSILTYIFRRGGNHQPVMTCGTCGLARTSFWKKNGTCCRRVKPLQSA